MRGMIHIGKSASTLTSSVHADPHPVCLKEGCGCTSEIRAEGHCKVTCSEDIFIGLLCPE